MHTGTYVVIGSRLSIYFERSADSDVLKVHDLVVDKETTEIPKLYVRHAEMAAIFADGGELVETTKYGTMSAVYSILYKGSMFLHACTSESCSYPGDPQNLS